MPFILTALPYFADKYLSHSSEIALVLVSIVIAVFLQLKDNKVHKSIVPLALTALSTVIFLLAFYVVSAKYEILFTGSGSSIMAFSYLINWRLHRKNCVNHSH